MGNSDARFPDPQDEAIDDPQPRAGPFKPFTQFPTPNLLARAQREYAAAAAAGGGQAAARTPAAVPAPAPPCTTKAQIFNPDDFVHTDNRALGVSRVVACGTLASVVQHLIRATRSDIEKVRALYVWIASQQDEEFAVTMDTGLDNAFNKVMLARRRLYDYNKLLHEMCTLAGIPCRLVHGGVKGFENQDDAEVRLDTNCWCQVYVAGDWRLCDQDFGSQLVSGGQRDWQVIATDMQHFHNQQQRQEQQERRQIFMLGEDYFLVDPERFIFDHFPADPQDQLLARPVTEQEFSEMACVNHVYFEWDIVYMSHPRATITTTSGALQLYFKVKRRDLSFRYVLFKHTDSAATHASSDCGGHLNQLVRLENKGDFKCFQICLKNIGLYKLQIFVPPAPCRREGGGGRPKGGSADLYMLVQYRIRCYQPFFGHVDNPLMPVGLQELGPGAAWAAQGIQCSQLYGGIITAKEGEAKLQLRTDNNGELDYMFELELSGSSQALETSTLLEADHEQATLYLRLPQHGTYLLKAYTGAQSDVMCVHTCNFMVECDMKCISGLFPRCFNHAVGAVKKSKLVTPITHSTSYVHVTRTQHELFLQMNKSRDEDILTTLTLCGEGDAQTDVTEYVWTEELEDMVRCFLSFRQAGVYKLAFVCKEEEAGTYREVWRYLLEVEEPTIECQPYPIVLRGWRFHYKLISPKKRFLKQNTTYHIEVYIPGAQRVYVVKHGENTLTELRESESNFSAPVSSESLPEKLVLYATFWDDESETQLLYFEVLAQAEFEALVAEHEQHATDARAQKRARARARKEELQNAKFRREDAKARQRHEQKEFSKMKARLFAEEQKAEEQAKRQRFQQKVQHMRIGADTIQRTAALFQESEDVHNVLLAAVLLLGLQDEYMMDGRLSAKALHNEAAATHIAACMAGLDTRDVSRDAVSRDAVSRDAVSRASHHLQLCDKLRLQAIAPDSAALLYGWVEAYVSELSGKSLYA